MTQAEALEIVKTGTNAFLTGEPGSGKTHTINEFIGWLREAGIEPSVTAATGIAATHVAGMTLHAWSGIGVASSLSAADIDRIASKEHVARRITKAKVLIIEEVSMLSAATLEMADAVCREVRRSERPFGGLTVILVGDFFQLPPVSRDKEPVFAYASTLWQELNPVVCYITEQHRQDDRDFLEVLSAVRSGRVGRGHRDALAERSVKLSTLPVDAPKLFSHNADVDRINADELAKLPGKAHSFRMRSKGKDSLVESLKRGCLSPETLELKEGAAVMFTKNSPQGRFANGTLGVVSGFDDEGWPIVKTKSGAVVHAEPMDWQVEEQGKMKARVTQVPLRLAYAMTVHKSQGMSMDAAIVDLSKAFEYGQGYVALSRVRRLGGLYLLGLNERSLEVHPEVLSRDREFRAASETAVETFAAMRANEKEDLQKKFVKAMGGAWPTNAGVRGEEVRAKNVKARASGAGAGLTGRLAETLEVVRDARDLKSAAKERGLTIGTVVKHLEELNELDRLSRADFAHLVPSDAADEIGETLAADTSGRLGPVFGALKGRYPFELIRLARLLKNRT